MVINHTHFGRFDDDWDDQQSAPGQEPPAYRASTQSRSESLVSRVDRLAKAVTSSHSAIRENGIAVDVNADGNVVTIRFDDHLLPGATRLGPVLADMINRARKQAQAQVSDVAREVQSDPRVKRMVEQIHNAPDLEVPRNVKPTAAEYDPESEYFRGRSRISDPDW